MATTTLKATHCWRCDGVLDGDVGYVRVGGLLRCVDLDCFEVLHADGEAETFADDEPEPLFDTHEEADEAAGVWR